MDLPNTLYGQLYLLAYDRRRRRFDSGKLWLLGCALRGAMLTELFLAGHLRDDDGMARRVGGSAPDDPLLRATVAAIDVDEPAPWSWLVVQNESDASGLVRGRLEEHGWIRARRRMSLGLIPALRPAPSDEAAVRALAERARQAVRTAFADRPAEPRALMLGLLAILGELPGLITVGELAEYREKLPELAIAAAVPILAVHEAVEAAYAELQAGGGSGAGCGGCGGGCGGCGGCGG